MRTTMITQENLGDYLPLLTEEEIFGLDADRFTLIGAFDEEKNEALGVISAEILPGYIRINRLCTAMGADDEKVREALLSIIKQSPEDISLPVCFFSAGQEEDTEFFLSHGFTEKKSKYYYIEGRLKDMTDFPGAGGEDAPEIRVLENVSEEELDQFIFQAPHDEIIQFPELPVLSVERDRFSDGSMVCFKNGKPDAAVLFQDYDGLITIVWMYGEEPRDIYYLFYVLKKMLSQEFESGLRIRFLLYENGPGAGAVEKIFSDSKRIPIRILVFK
ncbi:MAG: hypothetical protein IIZ75_10155 [Lachnospiraceae bacterium]|nr:hypothetical protein [Lachnospiraceae bacterium]